MSLLLLFNRSGALSSAPPLPLLLRSWTVAPQFLARSSVPTGEFVPPPVSLAQFVDVPVAASGLASMYRPTIQAFASPAKAAALTATYAPTSFHSVAVPANAFTTASTYKPSVSVVVNATLATTSTRAFAPATIDRPARDARVGSVFVPWRHPWRR